MKRAVSLCVLIASAAMPGIPHSELSAAGAEPNHRVSEILSTIRTLHSANPVVRASAEVELRSLGFSDEQLRTGWQLTHPDPRQRVELCRRLQGQVTPSLQQVQAVLLNDDRAEVRSAALELVEPSSAAEDVRKRVAALSRSDPDELVRARAYLLTIGWERAPQRPAPGETRAPLSPDLSGGGSVRVTEPSRVHSLPTLRTLTPVKPYWELPTAGAGESASSPSVRPEITAGSSDSSSVITAEFEEISSSLHPDGPLRLMSHGLQLAAASAGTAVDPSGSMDLFPRVLDRPIDPPAVDSAEPVVKPIAGLLRLPQDPPTGFAGRSGIRPTELQQNGHFLPREDRWRMGFPHWDRYEDGFPPVTDYPYTEGHWWDPYNQNVLKGDYPIAGQHTFLNVTATSLMLHEFREVPTATTPFESTAKPFQEPFFGGPRQYFYLHNFSLQLDLFHGSTAAFKPFDWLVRINPIFNMNYLDAQELGIVNPDVRQGTTRFRNDVALEQFFVEAKLADLSPDYDFLSIRVGSQPFVSDFRGFIFADNNLGARLFGTRLSNRDQFNLAFFNTLEKDTNSLLNTFRDRQQHVLIANYFRQDFIFPGYTAQASFHWNHEEPSFLFDDNNFLVRPDPAGVFRPHEIDAFYFGIAGDGHIGRYNVSNAFYWVVGHDSLNPIAGEPQDIDAKLAAVELSYDRDWIRFRTSFLWSSGDDDLSDNKAKGFDAIYENPNFAGGGFSYWQRNSLRLFGVNVNQREGLIPDLRSSKFQGQTNFVNPGLFLVNAGMDFEITPKTRVITNASYLWFANTVPLEIFTFQDGIDNRIGTDLSIGCEYRPFLNDNVIFLGGFSSLIPSEGLDDLFGSYSPFNLGEADDPTFDAPYSFFLETVMTY